jgi:hydrogenase maturation protease
LIGIGNRTRGDDGVGLEVARRLRDRVGPDVQVMESSGDPAALLAAWQGAETAIVVDAVVSGARPGTLIRCEVGMDPVPGVFSRRSTHELGLAAAIELARELDALPQALILYGIEGARFELGDGLSPAVEGEMDRILQDVLEPLRVTPR